MILITGAMGFIGMRVARELAARGDVVLGYNRTLRSPEELEALLGRQVETVQLDVSNPYSVWRAIARYQPEGIVHLAVPALGAMPPAEETMTNVSGLMNILEAAHSGGVQRVSLASSVTAYAGMSDGPFHEERDLPVASPNPTSAMKKAEEILAAHYADRTGLDVRLLRIGIIYGPLYHTLANLPSRLTHLAVKKTLPEHRRGPWTGAQLPNGLDLCYVADCARAIATIHTAPELAHRIYNVGSGEIVSTPRLVAAVRAAVPDAVLPDEVDGLGEQDVDASRHMDISRLRDELGFEPAFSVEDAIKDYAAWLQDHPL